MESIAPLEQETGHESYRADREAPHVLTHASLELLLPPRADFAAKTPGKHVAMVALFAGRAIELRQQFQAVDALHAVKMGGGERRLV